MIVLTILLWIVGVYVVAGFSYWIALLVCCREPMPADEIHFLKTDDGWTLRLLRCRPKNEAGDAKGEPVLLCHGAAGNHVSFDAPAGESLVDTLTARGYDCWMIELRGYRSSRQPAGRSKDAVTFEDFLLHDIPAALAHVCTTTGYRRVHWVGHSMGGMLLYAYGLKSGREAARRSDAARRADAVASGVTLGSPPGFEGTSHRSVRVMRALVRWWRWWVEAKVRALAPIFRLFRLNYRGLPINWDNTNPKLDTAALYNAITVPPAALLEQLDTWASTRVWRLFDGALDVDARLNTLRTPLFVICGAGDPFVSVERAEAFFKALPNRDKRMLVLSKDNRHAADYSHIDLLFGTKAREEVFGPVADWLEAHPIWDAAGAGKAAPKVSPAKKRPAKAKPAAKKAPARR